MAGLPVARGTWRQAALALAALLLALGGALLLWLGREARALDARLGADVMVAPAGLLGGASGPLLVDTPKRQGLPLELVEHVRTAPGVAAVVPLYNLGKLSAQECPA